MCSAAATGRPQGMYLTKKMQGLFAKVLADANVGFFLETYTPTVPRSLVAARGNPCINNMACAMLPNVPIPSVCFVGHRPLRTCLRRRYLTPQVAEEKLVPSIDCTEIFRQRA